MCMKCLKFKKKEVSNEYIKKIIEIDKIHVKKYDKRSMNIKELDKLCRVE